MLARYDISCDKEEAGTIRLGQLRGQQPATCAEYKEAVEACSSMDYIEYNVSQIARDILPKNNYSIDALQLLFAAFSSFVFGGMGSWNDGVAKNHKKHKELSKILYEDIVDAIVSAVNSF
ncbi:hypothetical protein [uncultured Alistipes sp.]|uniref:hypothetical protein n=1 Tax=uncultured Alistipes sp. TaxID=538949 RepID=UPI002599E863|nr:hypothetical protein [uncultured Alistipes sp.]